MNVTPIEWTDFSANPLKYRDKDGKVVWACVHESPGCKACYAEALSKRYGRGGPFNVQTTNQVTPFLDEKELRKMLTAKVIGGKQVSGSKCFIGDMTDVFGPWVPDELLDRLFDVMWQRADVTWQVLTKRVDRMVDYVQKRSSRRSFGWIDRGRTPLHPGQLIHMEDIRMRNQCGYVADEYGCDHPAHAGLPDSCDSRDCPIANRVGDRETLERIGVAQDFEFEADGYTDESEWMELFGRPVHAAPGNVWLGFSAEDQQRFNERGRKFQALRWILGPHFTLFASLEPLISSIDMHIPADPIAEDAAWSPLDCYDFGNDCKRPYLDWVIVGGESGPRARTFDLVWARSIIAQCRSAGVACFMKQLGSQPDNSAQPDGTLIQASIRDRKGGNPEEWASDLRVREFPAVPA